MLTLAGCAAPSYYLQAVRGHLEIMRARQDVDEFLAAAETGNPFASSLRVATDILEFAESELGLPAGDSYREFVMTGRKAVSWNVVAAPEFALEARRWCFPVAGCVSYRGYFREQDAREFAAKLARRGLDVAVSPVIAYSTLGWFADPLLDTMLLRGEAFLAATLFHELAHRRVYVKGDTTFNESFATFIEREGTRRWLAAHGTGDQLRRYQATVEAARQFQALLSTTRTRLAVLYASSQAEHEMREQKREILDDLETAYNENVANAWHGVDYYGQWFEQRPNNARLALVANYLGGVCAFRSLFIDSGADFARFHTRVQHKASLDLDQRTAWLVSACE